MRLHGGCSPNPEPTVATQIPRGGTRRPVIPPKEEPWAGRVRTSAKARTPGRREIQPTPRVSEGGGARTNEVRGWMDGERRRSKERRRKRMYEVEEEKVEEEGVGGEGRGIVCVGEEGRE